MFLNGFERFERFPSLSQHPMVLYRGGGSEGSGMISGTEEARKREVPSSLTTKTSYKTLCVLTLDIILSRVF